MDAANKELVDELIAKFALKNGQTEDEVKKSFEAVLDKFDSDGSRGQEALKFLGFEERPSVEDFIAALVVNPELMKMFKKQG